LNVALAAAVHASLLSRVSALDRGVRHARFKVLRDIRVPAILLEAGFLTSASEAQRIGSAQHRQELGAAIAQGIQTYDRAVNYRSNGSFTFAKANLPPHARSITEPLQPDAPTPTPSPEEPSVS